MAGDDAVLAIDQHRVVEAELADRAGNGGDLGIRMGPGVAGVGHEAVGRPLLDRCGPKGCRSVHVCPLGKLRVLSGAGYMISQAHVIVLFSVILRQRTTIYRKPAQVAGGRRRALAQAIGPALDLSKGALLGQFLTARCGRGAPQPAQSDDGTDQLSIEVSQSSMVFMAAEGLSMKIAWAPFGTTANSPPAASAYFS